MLVDSHCHLDASEFDPDRDAVVARAMAAGVRHLVLPAVRMADLAKTLQIGGDYACLLALGLHPIYINEHQDGHLLQLTSLLQDHRPQAIGECGLDFFVPGLDKNRQIEIFCAQLQLARDFDLPVLLHVRRAADEVLKYLRRYGIRRGIAHAFNGSHQQAAAYLAQGLKLGFGGNLSYERARNIRQLASTLPLESIVLETDAPDMSPSWLYKQRNEPAQLAPLAAQLAQLRQIDIAQLATQNLRNLCEVLQMSPTMLPVLRIPDRLGPA